MSDNDHTEFGGLDQGEYDALAELFLGDSTFAPPRRAPGRGEGSGPEHRAETATDEPSGEDSAVAQAKGDPGRVMPTAHPTPSTSPTARGLPRTRPPSLGPATVELVILGHLPVRAGLWLKEYAASVAGESAGPVALLRLAPDIASVDLIGSGGFEPHGPAPTFGDAVRRARIDASRFVLRVNETAEPALAENKAVDRVTILTGADEAALVASYRLVKSLAAAWDRQFEMDEGPKLRLAIMGSGDEPARAAAEKLQSAAESFLQRRVEIQICSGKIGASPSVPSSSIFRGEANESVADLLQLIRPSRGKPEAGPAAPSEPGLRLVGTERPAAETPSDDPMPEIVIRRAGARVPGQEPEQNPAPEPEQRPEVETAMGPATEPTSSRSSPSPTAQAHPPRMRRAVGSTLASRLEGLTTIETVCPFTSGVEFAAAADGSLHLITQSLSGAESRGGTDADTLGSGLGAGVERLLSAAAWARAHLSLLLRAEPLLAIPSPERSDDDGPVLHLLTGDAREARGLLDSDVFVHLCRPVEVGGESVWVTDDLN